jgi:uncharacterized protein (TIGR02147 family)
VSSWAPNIFEFLDYREYLRAYYDAGKKHSSAFSYRYFARLAGYSSPSFLRHVMRGERNLSSDSIERFAKALGLDKEEGRFFNALVEYEQAENAIERRRAFELITASRRWKQARRLDEGYFRYLSRWYYPVIREMTAREDFKEDAAWIASQLFPQIDPHEANEALEVLLELGLITRDDAGRLHRGEPSLSTGHEVRAMGAANYHRQMLERAAESIDSVDRDMRDLGAMTVCISHDLVPELKQRIHAFREKLLDLSDREQNPDVVYQFNTQLFPLSRWSGNSEDE